ncbi:sortase [Candidatus Amesbacteria bacterium]|nr:sortase [Candidatus Amesbacteria bacterium]
MVDEKERRMVLAKIVQASALKSGGVYSSEKKLPDVDIGLMVGMLRRVAKALRWYGMGVMMWGLAGLIWVWGPMINSNIKYQISNQNSKVKSQNHNLKLKSLEPNWDVPDKNYSIYIPKIGAVSRVIGDVDANNKNEYLTALKMGVAEAKGLAHPGQIGTTFLFAHSVASPLDYARYNAVFYLLDKLEKGDEVEIVYKNRRLRYEVETKEILEAKNTKYLINSDRELLVLQTCWPAGTRAKRLVLTAKRVMVY